MRFWRRFKVVIYAEILPRDFLQTLGNYCLSVTIAKIQGFKKFHKNFGQVSKALTPYGIINFFVLQIIKKHVISWNNLSII